MELNSEQIIKALECCRNNSFSKCTECPCGEVYQFCSQELCSEALALIKELLNRIEILESLNRVNDKVGEDYVALHAAYTELTQTCTTLIDNVKFWNEQYDALHISNAELADAIEKLPNRSIVTSGEVERLSKENENLRAEVGSLNHHADQADALIYALRRSFDSRAEAVREAIARIEEKSEICGLYVANSDEPIDTVYQITKTQLDQIAQEMLEEK